ncbi:Structural maintenance of chromosomes protein 6, partial [Elasticomyces elasticus]
MAPRKRSAEDDISDEDNGNASDNSSSSQASKGSNASSQASTSSKRRRISHNSDTTPDSNPPAPNNFDINARTINDEIPQEDGESEDDEDAEQQATQAIQRRRARDSGRVRVGKEAGVLSQVDLWNFMCHKRFTFDLGPLINFICGKNGSGKSAILTAIILCLGGKASTTNRGGNLKSFIKEGEDQARIVCRLRNRGEFAFQAEEYGDSIEVERHFSRAGTSGYKLKNERGRIVSTRKADLDALLDYFALQIDNPLNVLSQDMARSFIASSNPSEKYRFFIKGVQLEQLDQDYNLIQEQLENIRAKLQRKEGDIMSLEERMIMAKDKFKLAQRKDGIKEKIRDLRRQITWVQIMEQEDILQGFEGQIGQADEGIARGEEAVNECDQRYQQADAENHEASQALEEVIAKTEEIKLEVDSAREELNEVKGEATAAQAEQRNVKDQIRNANNIVKATEQKIEAEEARLAEINGGGAAQRLSDLDTAKERVTEAKHELDEHKASLTTLNQTIQEASAEEKERKKVVEKRRAEQSQMGDDITKMRRTWQNRPDGFKPNTDTLVREIERETRWTRKPIGPIGKHVRLLRPEWSSILEKMFGGSLSGFCCFSKHDTQLLGDLKRRVQCDADVFTINDHSLTPNEPDQQYDTILRALDIDNEHIKKFLIIQHGIEQIMLIEDLQEATSTMFDNGRIRNVRGCFAMDDNDKRRGYFLKHTNAGDPSQDPVQPWAGPARMKTDLEATIAAKQRELENFETQTTKESVTAWNAIRAQLMKDNAALKRHSVKTQDLTVAYQGAEDQVQRLEAAISEDTIESG